MSQTPQDELLQLLGPSFSAEALSRLQQLDPTGEAGLMARLLQAYQHSLEALLQDIRAGSQLHDLERVRRAAHTLKSSSATMGAAAFASICSGLESAIREGLPADPQALSRATEPALQAGADLLCGLRAALSPSPCTGG